MKWNVVTWLFQRVSGVFLVAGLVIHFAIMHYSGHEQIHYEMVVKRLSDPYWKAFDLLLLLSVIYHGFNGLWGITLEYAHSARMLRTFKSLVLTAALLLTATGIYILAG